MTAIELVQTCQDLISEETFDRFTKAEIMRWLNRGLEDIAVKTGYMTWKWLVTTEANKREYPYPDTAKSIYRMEYNNQQLPPCDIPGMDEETEETAIKWLTATGPPENWYHSWNRAFGISPTPDAEYSVYLYGLDRSATLSDDASVPLIPDQFHLAPAYFAAKEIVREDKELITMGSVRSDYRDMLRDMVKEKRRMSNLARGRTIKLERWSA